MSLKSQHQDIYDSLKARRIGLIPFKADVVMVPRDRYRSKWERQYAEHLAILQQTGEIVDWRYEELVFPLAIDATYKPDFIVTLPGTAKRECHEVKGERREAAMVRFRVAREHYKQFTWKLIELDKAGHGWREVTV